MRVLALSMEMHVFDQLVFDSCIRRHHISKDSWMPVINEELVCAQESGNPHDPYAVVIKKGSLVVGCAQKNFSCLFAVLMCWNNYSFCNR